MKKEQLGSTFTITRAMEAGANEYLSKPVDLKQLTDLITRLTEEQ